MKKIFTLVLATMLLIAPQVVRCQEELTVYENATATSTQVPVNGTWTDAYLKCEFVIPADQLDEMDGGTVSQMTFFLTIPAGAAWVGTFQVFLKEVDNTTINAYYGPDNATVVYEGNLDGSQSTMNVEFNETYTYGGGNLLVGVYQIVEGNYKAATFAGESITGACVQGYSGSSLDAVTVNQRNFIPKTKFTYTPDSGGGLVCEKPTGITTSNITSNSATVNWTGDGSAFNLQYKASNTTDWTEVNGLSGVSYNLTGLTSNTTYNVRVQQVCEEGTSTWKSATFNTPLGIPMVEPFDATSIPTDWAQYTGLLSNVLNGSILASATYGWNFGNKNGTFDSHAYVNVYGTGCQRWLVSPVLQMEDNVVLSFDMALTAYGGTLGTPGANGVDDKFAVLITTDGGSTWEILRQWDNNGSEYVYNNIPCSADGENVSFDLSSYAGQNIAIAFYGESTVSNADNNLHIDNVRIDYGLPCKRPTGLAVTEVAPNSAILSWNENGSATAWQLCLNEDTTNLVTADNNPFTLTGLTPETAYTVKVRANCGSDGVSRWGSPVTFTTASCPAPVTLDTAVCASELPLTWRGHTFGEYGSFTDTLITADGCDSIVTLQVRNLSYYSSLLSDDFNDGVIDPTKWTYTGNAVVEEDGLLKLYENVTDQPPHLLTVDLNVPANGKVTMDRKFMVHRANNYFYAYYSFNLDGGADYVGLGYNYTTYDGWYGTYLFYKLNGMENVERVWLCDATFDSWITEHVELDFTAGTLSYYLDTLMATVSIPGLSDQTVDYFNVEFRPDGWWTGHQHFMDYVEIQGGMSVVRTAPASEVAYTTATCGGDVAPNECVEYTVSGVCWSTSQNPTLNDAHTTDGTGTGTFTSELTGLAEGTTYYVRAYALGGSDTVYGQMVSFTTCRHFTSEFEATICENALPYVWNEVSYNASGDYTQTFLTAANCDSVVTLHLTVLPPPVIEIARAAGHSATVCESAATAIEAVVTGGYGEVTSYLWWENGNLLPGETNVVLNIDNLAPNANDIYTVEVAQTGSGCYNTASAALNTLVTVYPQFTVNASAPATVCDNATLTLTATMANTSSDDELTYQWYGVPTSETNAATYTLDNLQAGSYDYFVAVTGNVSGCYAESEPVHVDVLPTYHTTLYDTICQGYDYDFFGQLLTESGPYTHTLQAENGCDSVITLELTVYLVYTVAVTASETTVCEGNTLTLNAGVQGVIPNDVPEYQWYQMLNGNQMAVNGAVSTSYSTSDLLVGNTYEYFLTLTSNMKGCSAVSNTVAATVVPLPTVTIAGPSEVKLGLSVTLTASGAESYVWSANDANIGNAASVTVSPEETTTYSVTGTDQYGCTGTASVTVTTVFCPDPVTLDTTVCASDMPLTWRGHTFTESETYTATYQTAVGCDSVVTLNLTVIPSITGAFTTLTPENDSLIANYPVRFAWNAVENAPGYDLYVWPVGEPQPQQPTASQIQGTQYVLSELPNNTDYQWFVKTYNACGTVTSTIRHFSLNVTPALTVTSGNPVDFGEVPFNSTRSVFFQVNATALESPITYQITSSDASSFSLAPANTWDDLHGGRMQLTFHPTVPQSDYTAQMTFQSGNLVQTVTLAGALSDFYTFTTSVDDEVYAMDSDIPIHGQVINLLNEPVAGLDVEVVVKVMEYVRTLPATTDANGQFTVMFTPQHSEAGHYTVGSRRAGRSSQPEHDDFNIPGMMLTSSDWILWNPTLDNADTGTIAVRNRSQLPLTNIQVTPLSLPDGCTVQFLPLNLAGMATGNLQYIVSGSVTSTGVNYEEVPLHAVSDEGATMDFSAWFYCIPQRADLDVLPMSLVTTMTRGKSKIVDFMIYNNGTGSTGNIYVSLPDVPWMSVVGSDTLPSLVAHDSAHVSIRLSADSTTSLVRHTGSFAIHCERGEGVNIPYDITAISDSTGTLVVDVTDEYAWNTNNGHGPHLAGASVTVRGYYSLETVATGVTDENGLFVADNLPEGWYRLIIRANRHAEYQNNLYITAGDTNLQDIFIPFQAITYSWDVVPTEIEDVYTYELNVDFETHVPKPVVTMDIDRTLPLLEGCEMGEFNVLATNHGLVAAMDVSVVVPQSDYFVFTPLVSHIDSLPALTTYTIPVTYQRKTCTELLHLMSMSAGPKKALAKASDYYDGITCDKGMFNLTYYYICRETHWETVISEDLKYDTPQEVCGDTSRPVVNVQPEVVGPGPSVTDFGGDIAINPDWVRNYPYINLPNLTGYEPGIRHDTVRPVLDRIKICDPNLTPCQNVLNGLLECLPLISLTVEPDNTIQFSDVGTIEKMGAEIVKNALEKILKAAGLGVIGPILSLAEEAWCISDATVGRWENIKTCFESWTNPNTASEIRERDISTVLSLSNLAVDLLNKIETAASQVNEQIYNVILEEMPNAMASEGGGAGGSAWSANGPQPPVFSKKKDPVYEGQITDAGRAQILAACLEIDNSPEVEEIVNAVVDRWNHSIEAWSNDYFTAADAPEGYDTNFIQVDTNIIREFYELNEEAVSQGYTNIFQRYNESVNALQEAMDEYQENLNPSSLCATVTVQFTQKMTMTREAFEGTLTINNGHESEPMQDIDVDFVIRDENGVDCTNLFQINFLSYNNITGENGNASLDAENEGSIIVQFIPTRQAAPEISKVYAFGGTFSFTDPFTGEYMVNELYPVDIRVHPSPDLYVNYFMQRDILGDDPLTEENVEPVVPAELGVIIHNRGAGTAKNVILETAEPRIIDNAKGLAVDFAMYGAAFNGSERQLGLMAIPFGNIEPGRTGVGEWWFTSTLLGHFVSYEAHVIHNSSFGNPDLSLVSSLRIHPLIHTVYAYGNLDDGINDFLVDDVDDYRHYPDSLYFSNGSRTGVAIADSIDFDHYVTPTDTIVQLTLNPSRIGWNYEQTWDPGRGQYKLISCTRNSDQQVIPLSNVWQSFVTLPVGGDPVYEDRLHIVDTLNTDQPVTYTLVFSLHDLVLEVDTILNVPDSIIAEPLSEVTVKFNKPIVDSTFNYLDLNLKCNNGENLLDENLNVERIDSVTYKLHLEPYTIQSGYYVLDILTADITDADGFNGYYTGRATWTQNIPTCQPDSVTISATACESYTWAGVTYDESGDITRTFYNVAGCDSVVTLHLTVNHGSTGDTTAVVCNHFDWYEHTNLTEDGDFTHTFTNVAGCDSVVTLHLTVIPCDPNAVVVTIVGHTGTNGYDGTEHSVSGYDVTAIEIGGAATTLYTAADFSLAAGVEATAGRTDAGQTNMGLTAASFVNNNTDFEQVVFLVTDGWQRIGKRSVTISLDSNKVYDGEVFTVNADQLHVTGLLEGQTLTGQLWTEEADPGVYENHNGFFQATLEAGVIYSSLAVQDATSSNVTANYAPAFDVTLIIEGTSQPCTGVTYQGYDYEAVEIGTQCWLTEDLRIPVGDHHYYKDDPAYFEKFGYLYSWYTAVGVDEGDNDAIPEPLTADDGTPYVQGICPPGWAVPSMADIAELNTTPGSTSQLKDPSTEYWLPGFEGVAGGTGFNARGGGRYNAALDRYEDLLTGYHFWAADATPGAITIMSACVAYFCDTIILTDPNQKNDRKSVRCIRKVAQ